MAEETIKKKKKQHYVPQCYLKAWAMPNTYQVNVYDKKLQNNRINNIIDVASENYFYDIDFKRAMSEAEKMMSGLTEEEMEEFSNTQFIENLLAEEVERDLSTQLNRLIENVAKLTPWKYKNCYFISKEEKRDLSFHIAMQRLRTKSTRTTMIEVSDCFEQMLRDMGASTRTLEEFSLTKDSVKLMHGKMMIDIPELISVGERINDLIWILGVNNTNTHLFASDNPVGTFPHVRNEFMANTGIMSEGVEVFFPISPKLILLMFDRQYHKIIENIDRHYLLIDKSETIDHYNALCVQQSERCVFSVSDDFSIIENMLKMNPNILNKPHVSATWNGKLYTAKGNNK